MATSGRTWSKARVRKAAYTPTTRGSPPPAQPVAAPRVDAHRPAVPLRLAQRGLQRAEVVPVHRPDVLDAEVLEQRLRRDRVLDPLLDRVQRLVQRRPDQRGVPERVLDQIEQLL